MCVQLHTMLQPIAAIAIWIVEFIITTIYLT